MRGCRRQSADPAAPPGNGRGSVLLGADAELAAAALEGANTLDRPVQRE